MTDATGAPWTGPAVYVVARLRLPADCGSALRNDGWVMFDKSTLGTFSGTLDAYDDAPRAPRCLQTRVEEGGTFAVLVDTLIANAPTGPTTAVPVTRVELRVPRAQP